MTDHEADRAKDHPKGPGDSLLRAIVQGSNDAVFAKDLDGRYVWLNPRHARFLGRSAEEVVGHRDEDLFSEEFARHLALLDSQVLETHVPVTYEVASTATGEEQVFLTTKGVYYNNGHSVAGLIGISRDVTEERQQQAALQEFFAMTAHDIRSPLSAIKAAVELAADEAKQGNIDEVGNYLNEIDSLSNRLLRLARDLLDISQIESASFSLERLSSDLPSVVTKALREVSSSTVEIDVQIPSGLPPVYVDPGRLAQVLTNLVNNALRFAEPNTVVRIDAERHLGEIVIRVRNQGPGIPPGKVPFLFQKFSRLHENDPRGTSDTGLGLSICKGLIDAHGGDIWMERNEERSETVFAFSLPLGDQSSGHVPQEP